jgi:hypothetical protein
MQVDEQVGRRERERKSEMLFMILVCSVVSTPLLIRNGWMYPIY